MRALLMIALVCASCRGDAAAPSPLVLSVAFVLEGADAATIETSVVLPVEEVVMAVPGLAAIESRIETDHATVNLELAPNADLDRATHELHHLLGTVDTRLPRELAPPTVQRVRRDDTPVLSLSVQGSLPIGELSARVHQVVKPRLERLGGVMRVELRGLAEETVIVRPDVEKLVATGLTVFDVIAALQATTASNIQSLGDLVIKDPVRLRDIANVELGFERSSKDTPAIAIYSHPQADRAAVAKTVRKELAGMADDVQLVERPPVPVKKPALVVSLRGPELEVLGREAEAITTALVAAKLEVERDPAAGVPERTYTTDRDAMARLGIPMADVAATLRAFAGAHAGTLVGERGIVVRVPIDAFTQLQIRTQRGELVPIASVVTATVGISHTILRRDRERTIVLSIHGSAATARAIVRKRDLPVGYRIVMR